MKLRQSYLKSSRYFCSRYAALFVVLMAVWPSVDAAYCSLRDPVNAIRTLYPEADKNRSIVRTIGRDTRKRIRERLPFTLHFNELGRHTLYVAQRQDLPLGFVHARSELSEWGLVEIAWAINANLEIAGFYFQRCRSADCNEALREKLSLDLLGKSTREILMMLTPNGEALVPAMVAQYPKNNGLVLSIIRSALKTIVATEYGWADDITELRRNMMVMQWLKSNDLPELVSVTNSELEAIKIPADIAPEYAFIERSSIRAFRVMVDGNEVARLVDAQWRVDGQSGKFGWLFSPQGEVLAIKTYDPMPDKYTAVAFNKLLGQDMELVASCASMAEMAGSALYLNAYKQVEVVK